MVTCFNSVMPIMVAHMVAIVADESSGAGHLVSKSLLVVAMATARVESFQEPLASCIPATAVSGAPDMAAQQPHSLQW